MTKFLGTALVGIAAALLPAAAEASITIYSNYMEAGAYDGVGGSNYTQFFGTSIPTYTTLDAVAGAAYSKNVIDWSTNGGQTTLSFDMDHQRTGNYYSYGYTYDGALYFTANANTPYELSGDYQATDFGINQSGRVYQYAQLYDQTAGSSLFYNYQESWNTPNEQLLLGSTGGDSGNSLFGSLTGSLIAGHSYFLYFQTLLHAYPDGDSGASAVGNFTLKIGEASELPEPLSLFVWGGLALVGAVVTHRKRHGNS